MNVLSVFDGISAGRLALERAGIEVNKYYRSEIDKFASKVAMHHYPADIQLGDVTKWREWGIDWKHVDLLIGGSPCFVAGTKILSIDGYKNIEDIKIGEKVLTHAGNWEKVLNIGGKIADIFELKAQGMLPTQTTFEHPYLVRTMGRKWNNEKRTSERVFSDSEWKKAGELKKGDFIAIPRIKDSENTLNLSNEDCFVIGRYIADGHTRQDKRITEGRPQHRHWQMILSIGSHKIPEINMSHSLYKHTKSVHRLVISSKRLVEIVEYECGNHAINKKISSKLLKLPKDKLEILINGLLSGDGSKRGNEYRLTTVSKELAQSLCLAIAKVYGVCASIEFTKRPEKTIIEGRVVNQNDTYTVSFRKEVKKQSKFYVDDDYIWTPVKSMEKTGKIKAVFNIEVENDNTYTANNIVVHNCQGFSFAGKQAGTKAVLNGEETLVTDRETYKQLKEQGAEFLSQSHLFWEYVLILDHIKKHNPNVKFLLENVKMKKELLHMISDALGVKDVVINSSLLSAQNRHRHYWANWEITQPENKGILLRDILEDGEVDRDKSYCIDANYFKGGNPEQYFKKSRRQLVFGGAIRGRYNQDGSTSQQLECNEQEKTNALTTVQKDNVVVYPEITYRKLTPTECARLQTFPEVKKSFIMQASFNEISKKWFLELQKNCVNAVELNLKLQKNALTASTSESNQFVSVAERFSNTSQAEKKEHAQKTVHILLEGELLRVKFQERFILSVSIVDHLKKYPHPIHIEGFAEQIAGINTILEKTINHGKEVQLIRSTRNSTNQQSGRENVLKSQIEINGLAENAELNARKEVNSTSIISDHALNSQSLNLSLQTLFCYVLGVIDLYTQEKINQVNLLDIRVDYSNHWASIVSKSQAYKAYGNSWTVDVIAHIFKCMLTHVK